MTPISDDNNRFVPRLEGLEVREVPAVQIFVTEHVLHIFGAANANVITVRDNGQGTITVNAGSEHFTASGIDGVQIATGAGGDRVNYKLTGPLKIAENIKVWLGKGADKANFNFSDGIAAGGHLKLTVDGGPGTDRETVKIGSVAKGGSADLDMNGGKGYDTLQLDTSGKVAGYLKATLNGGAGHNTEEVVILGKVIGMGYMDVIVK
jgi:hypothetical protein